MNSQKSGQPSGIALLAPDNFTPPQRTPWGGTRIVGAYKAGLVAPDADPVVGESWEASVEPDFPSRLDGTKQTLAAWIDARGPETLGEEARRGRTSTALLVKLLDAADNLSVQIHPTDDYGALAPDQAGKPESWYVLGGTEGAGLYLGLRKGVTEAQMRACLEAGGDASALLYFVPVSPGDFFVIDAGTAHAIGKGVTLVEPQHVLPGKRGVTYRYWDWNRRYDAEGRPSETGDARPLHVDDALAVTAWDAPREEALLKRIRYRAGAPDLLAPLTVTALCGPGLGDPDRGDQQTGVNSAFLSVARVAGTGEAALPPSEFLRSVTVVSGRLSLHTPQGQIDVGRGRTAILAADHEILRLEGDRVHAVISSVA